MVLRVLDGAMQECGNMPTTQTTVTNLMPLLSTILATISGLATKTYESPPTTTITKKEN